MKKFFIFCLMAFVMCSCNLEQKRLEQERAIFVADSLAKRELFVEDSIAKVKNREQEIADSICVAEFESKNKTFFKYRKDEFSNIVWVEPKNAPKYRNANGIYCYFALIDNKPQIFRFVFQYYAEDWLFIKNMVFNIDGKNYCIEPTMETDCGYGGKIWEWCDEKVYKTCSSDEIKYTGLIYTEINESFIKELANAKSVKVKMNGSKYYNTKTLSSSEILSIKRIYTYFTLLKGEF